MTPEDAVTYLRESQSIGSGVYGRICPRCGGPLEGRMVMNALSRRVPLYICSDCGVDEAMLDFRGQCPLPLEKWPLVREVMSSS